MQPYRQPLGTFRGNVAHSCKSALDINDQINPDHTIRKNGEWGLDGPFYFDDFTMYANRTGLYAGIGGERTNVIYRNNILADNQQYVFFATYQLVTNSLLVADSGNNLLSSSLSRNAFLLHDGAGRMADCHLVGFNAANASLFQTIGASTKHPNTLFTRLTFNHAGPPRSVLPDADFIPPDYAIVNSQADPRLWGSVIVDVNGSVGGLAGRSIIGNHPMMHAGGEILPANWTRTYFTTNQFAHLRLRYFLAAAQIPNVTFTREKTGTTTKSYFYGFKVDPHHQIPVIVNGGFSYTAEFAALPATRSIEIHFDDTVPGDNVLLRVKSISNLSGLSVPGMTLRNSLVEFQSAPTHSYFKDVNGDLWLRFVATGKIKTTTISWSN